MSGLRAKGLTISAAIGGARVEMLRDIDLEVAPGRVLGLVGESGAGKSMIGRVIAGSLPAGFTPARGSLTFDSADLLSATVEQRRSLLGDRIAFIPQEPLTALNPALTIEQQFSEHLARLNIARGARHEKAIAMLREVRLREPERVMETYPFQLSGGMCQRVLIAMAFASRPALVVADEPTTALDVSTQAHIVQIIRRMRADSQTSLLFITHDLRLAAHVCDDIMVLYAGDVVERGPARAVTEAPRHPYTQALMAANPPLSGALRRLRTLPDQMPAPTAFAQLRGCRFAPRCPSRNPACETTLPPLALVGEHHWARCAGSCGSMTIPEAPLLESAAALNIAAAPILKLEDVTKTYRAPAKFWGAPRASVQAVKRTSLDIGPGEFVGVVGESGSGKSTLGRIVMGLAPPSTGRILIEGRDVTAMSAEATARRLDALQMVFQDPQSALNPRRTVFRLMTQSMEGRLRKTSRAQRAARATELSQATGLPPQLLGRFPSQLSGGQKQRVNIARALCVTPRLLVADEIVSGLDVSVQAQILNLLLDLRAHLGVALLFISHDLAVVRYLCSRVLVMFEGEIVEQGETEKVFADPQHPYTRALLAAAPPEDLNMVWPPTSTSSPVTPIDVAAPRMEA